MDPPLESEASFSATNNPSTCGWPELLSLPLSGRVGLRPRTGGGADGLMEESTVTEQSGGNGGNVGGGKRKRVDGNCGGDDFSKLVSTCSDNTDLNKLKGKQMLASGSKDENGGSREENSGAIVKPAEEKSKPEPPKGYIHVRARRGQATDSHSLAERARREKISERMKILQDLVPGSNKVIGKALVLDEIINYVQSLQQQVEFLSMKLEAVNSRLNPMIEGFPSKDLAAPTFDANLMIYGLQTPREYAQGTRPEWLHMHVGSGFQREHWKEPEQL